MSVLDSFWGEIAAAVGSMVIAIVGSRTARFKAWRAKRKAERADRENVPSVLRLIQAALQKLTDSDNDRKKQITAIDEKLDMHTVELKSQSATLADTAAVTFGQMDQDPTPRFTCNNDGYNRTVNTAFARMLHCGRDELSGYGYRQFLLEKYNPTYFSGFRDATTQHRSFECEVIFNRTDGTFCEARLRLMPHPEAPPSTHWHGTIRYLRECTPP